MENRFRTPTILFLIGVLVLIIGAFLKITNIVPALSNTLLVIASVVEFIAVIWFVVLLLRKKIG